MKPFVHLFGTRHQDDTVFCFVCGVVKRADGRITGCRGRVFVAVRGMTEHMAYLDDAQDFMEPIR